MAIAASRPAVAWQPRVPEAIRSLDTLASTDYADLFSADIGTAPPRSAARWVGDALGNPPGLLGTLIPLVHRYVLGLRLRPKRSPENLFGWTLAERTPNRMRLEASGPLITAHLILQVDERQLVVATFVRYNCRLARIIWPPVSLIHRQVGIVLLRHALRSPALSAP